MNIITNKEVFSEENQANMPKKVGRRPGRPRKAGGTPRPAAQAAPSENAAPSQPQPSAPQPAAAPVAPHADSSTRPTAEPRKTVFYQASRPRTGQAPATAEAAATTPAAPAAHPATPAQNQQPATQQPQRPAFQPRPQRQNQGQSQGQSQGQGQQQGSGLPFGNTRRPRRPLPGAILSGGQQQGVPRSAAPEVPDAPLPIGHKDHPDNPRNPGRFQAPPRRQQGGRYPQDTAGVFMKPGGIQQGLSPQTAEPVQRSNSAEKLKIIPLGGLEEIGKNMTVFEYGNDIIIIDMGFQFPESDMLGIDYVIPDVTYLEDKKDKIRGAIITHGHLDHTGAIPYIVQKLGFPTLYGTAITMGMAKGRLSEFGLEGRNKLVSIVPEKDVLQLGVFTIRPFRLMHSIPGAIGLEIETPNGRISYCTDWKFDYTPASGEQVDFRTLAAIGSKGVDLLFSDSTNVDRPGHSISEKVVETSILTAVNEAKGRVIIAMFSSDLNRVQMALNAAAKNGRKVLVVGRSMQQNVEMAIGLEALNMPSSTIISEREINRFPDDKIMILSTGAQGEDRAALSRMASGEHRVIKIKKGDTVILSSSPIPGNERAVSGVMDKLYKAGASVIYNKIMDTHTSGHAYQEDLKLMLALMRPKYFVPLHGERSRLIMHGKLAQEVGVQPENVIIGDNGLILEMDNTGRVYATENHAPAGYVMVDGLGVGDVGNIVLRDRQAMAQEGVFFIVSVYDAKNKRFLNSPDLISRGFIYMRENEGFVNEVRNEIKGYLQKAVTGSKSVDIPAIRNDLRDRVSKLLYEKTERQPMVIPVIIEV